jgi:hypothetical protein
MNDAFSLTTYAAGALGLALFVTTPTPDHTIAAAAPTKAVSCQIGRFGTPAPRTNVFAAISAADHGRAVRL